MPYSIAISELMKCSKPLIFEDVDEAFPFGIRGTGFLVQLDSRYFGITAQHCVATNPVDSSKPPPESVRFQLDCEPDKFLPLKTIYLPKTLDKQEEDWDFSDFAIYEFESSFVPSSVLEQGEFLDMNYHIRHARALRPGTAVSLIGYPASAHCQRKHTSGWNSCSFEATAANGFASAKSMPNGK
ncbi:MAG: hypothetical protein HY043_01080 [Verrucomicrobia bacterium]|nr:hypothetical protein [Verrucomicrobiota bacterium]